MAEAETTSSEAKMIEKIWLIISTSGDSNHASQSGPLTLKVKGESYALSDIPSHPDRGRGGSSEYSIALAEPLKLTSLQNKAHFVFKAETTDAWLPRSVWVIGKMQGEDRRYLLAHNEAWPTNGWIGTDESYANGAAAKARNFTGAKVHID